METHPHTSPDGGFRRHLGPLLLISLIFYGNFSSRVILSPLMPAMEKELSFGHDTAGFIFFCLTAGYFVSVLLSGFVSRLIGHKGCIVLSTTLLALAMLGAAWSEGLGGLQISVTVVGLAAGLYLPSGIASIQAIVEKAHWGKAMAVHELAPNLAFLTVPLLAEALLNLVGFRGTLAFMAVGGLLTGLTFWWRGQGSSEKGQPPSPANVKILASLPSYWIMVALFGLGVSGTLGVFSMAPLYLVHEHGLDRTVANSLLAGSRVITMGTAILAGYMVDRLGTVKAMGITALASGMASVLMGLLPTGGVLVMLYLQPMVAVMFFPAGFAALGMIGPPKIRGVVVAMTVPPGFLIGGGLVPAGLGYLGQYISFSTGLVCLGVLTMAGAFLTKLVKLEDV